MGAIESWLAEYGLLVVLLNVAADAAGLPLPSFPLLLVGGAMAAKGTLSVGGVLAAALAGALAADLAWYALGRAQGRRLLALLCRISLSPDSCVRQTETIYLRHGAKALLLAKFIPGFAVIAAAMAGQMRLGVVTFLVVDVIGSLLWASAWIGAGMLAGPLVGDLVALIIAYGRAGAAFVAAALALFIAWKWWQRRLAVADRAIDRVDAATLRQWLAEPDPAVLVDVRSPEIQVQEGRIPGALSVPVDASPERFGHLARDVRIVVYCGCPNEVSAVHLVKRLRASGWLRARPLAGGVEAWREAGLPLEAP